MKYPKRSMSKNTKILIVSIFIVLIIVGGSILNAKSRVDKLKVKEEQSIQDIIDNVEISPTSDFKPSIEYDYNNSYIDKLKNSLDDVSLQECNNKLGDIIVGKWITGPSEYLESPVINFYEDGTFAESSQNAQDKIVDGRYILDTDKGFLELDFDTLDQTWQDTLADVEIYEMFPSMVSYDPDTLTIVLSVGYLPKVNEAFSGECQKDSFVINYFGNFLFQSEYVPF